MTKDLISVIIPCYNVEPWLEDLFASLKAQTYKNFEVIFVNDGSIDNTLQKLSEFSGGGTLTTKIINQTNQGVSAARNAGVAVANGEFVCFVDPDDFLAPNYLQTLHNLIGSDFDCALCQSKSTKQNAHFKNKISTKKQSLTTFLNNAEIMNLFFNDMRFFSPCNKMFRTNILKKMQNFPNVFNIKYYYSEDFDFNYRYLSNTKNAILTSEKLYYYRQRRGSALHCKYNIKRLSSLIAIDSLMNDCKQNHPHCYERLRNLRISQTIGNLMQMRLHCHTSYEEVYPLIEYLDNNIQYSLTKSFKICYPLMKFVFFRRILKEKKHN